VPDPGYWIIVVNPTCIVEYCTGVVLDVRIPLAIG
jgi:hypothetical protein